VWWRNYREFTIFPETHLNEIITLKQITIRNASCETREGGVNSCQKCARFIHTFVPGRSRGKVMTRFWQPHLSRGIPNTSVVSWISPFTSDVSLSCDRPSFCSRWSVGPSPFAERGVSLRTARSMQHSPNKWQSSSQKHRRDGYLYSTNTHWLITVNAWFWSLHFTYYL